MSQGNRDGSAMGSRTGSSSPLGSHPRRRGAFVRLAIHSSYYRDRQPGSIHRVSIEQVNVFSRDTTSALHTHYL